MVALGLAHMKQLNFLNKGIPHTGPTARWQPVAGIGPRPSSSRSSKSRLKLGAGGGVSSASLGRLDGQGGQHSSMIGGACVGQPFKLMMLYLRTPLSIS